MAEQALKAAAQLPEHSIRVVAIEEPSALFDLESDAMNHFLEDMGESDSLWFYNGNPNVMRALLHRSAIVAPVFGYEGHDLSPSGESRLRANRVGMEQIVDLVLARQERRRDILEHHEEVPCPQIMRTGMPLRAQSITTQDSAQGFPKE